jgi:hypothetical protein
MLPRVCSAQFPYPIDNLHGIQGSAKNSFVAGYAYVGSAIQETGSKTALNSTDCLASKKAETYPMVRLSAPFKAIPLSFDPSRMMIPISNAVTQNQARTMPPSLYHAKDRWGH